MKPFKTLLSAALALFAVGSYAQAQCQPTWQAAPSTFTADQGINGIIYPSLRHAKGTCFAVLFPHAVQSVAQGDVFRLRWTGQPLPSIQKVRS